MQTGSASTPDAQAGRRAQPGEVAVSVLVPARDEAGALPELLSELRATFGAAEGIEILVIDDGSRDGSIELLRRAKSDNPRLRILTHEVPAGQTAAILSGARAARGAILAMIDGDGQNPAGELKRLVLAFQGYPEPRNLLLIGERQMRADTLSRRLASRLANWLRGKLLGDGVADGGSGLKVCRREDFLALPWFDHAHRFLPALFEAAGGVVVSIPVAHRARRHGRSHYGIWDRALAGFPDLLGVLWLQRRRIRARAREIE